MVSFAVKKFLSLIRSHLFIFVFISITVGNGLKRSCCSLCQCVPPMFFSKGFIIYGLAFRSSIHFEFIFCIVLKNVLISFVYM